MIAQNFLQPPQSYIFTVSIVGFVICDIGIFLGSVKGIISESAKIPNYFILGFSSFQILIYIILLITAIALRKYFIPRILNSHLKRFLLFFDFVIIHAIEIFFGIYYNMIDTTVIIEHIENKFVLVFSFLLLIFWLIFIIGLIISFKYRSEYESKHSNDEIDLLRNPQKTVFIVSLFGLFLSTFIVYLLTSFWISKCNVHKSKCPEGFTAGYCSDNEEREFGEFCSNKVTIYMIFAFGILQILIFFCIMLTALTCRKGDNFFKSFERPSVLYILIAIEATLYFIIIFVEIYTFVRYNARTKDQKLKIATLFFASLQALFLLIFVIGIFCVVVDKSNKNTTSSIHPILIKTDKDI